MKPKRRNTEHQKKYFDGTLSLSSKPATKSAAIFFSFSVARPFTPNVKRACRSVTNVATTTKGTAFRKNGTKPIPAAWPTMIFGTLLMSVRRPPMFVRSPSVSRKPRSRSLLSSLFNDTVVSDPTIIIAVTLLSTAEKMTVRAP